MFQRVFIAAIVAGVVAGVCAFGVQRLRIIPLIQQAEVYEAAAAEKHAHDHAAHDPGSSTSEQAWEPEGVVRAIYTLIADILAGVGFALVLTGAMALASLRGFDPSWRHGLVWGASGFVVFTLAPSLGLPPELPGMEAAELGLRQLWWVATAVATAAGLGLIAFRREGIAKGIGAALIALPHLVGPPHATGAAGGVPPELAAQFVSASIVTAGLFWLALGATSGWLFRRLG
jgi:cobalt transporter subunit CbtA